MCRRQVADKLIEVATEAKQEAAPVISKFPQSPKPPAEWANILQD